MKRRIRILTGLSLLAVAGIWFFWPRMAPKTATSKSGAASLNAVVKRSVAAGAAGGAGLAAGAPAKFPTLNTNKLAYRLSNATNSVRKWEAMPHAILLANAFIDTDKGLDLKIPDHLRSAGDPGAYIVQARGPIDARFRAALAEAGAQIVSYIPNNAYLVNVAATGAGMLSGNRLVQAVLPYEPYYKLQSSLLGLAVNQQELPPGTALTLGLFGADAVTAEAQVENLGAKIIGRDQSPFGPVLRVLAPPDWTELVQSPVVQFVEPAYARRVANDLSRVTLGISPDTTSSITNGYAINGYVPTGTGVLVAVNDTGVDTNHPDFSVGGTAQAPLTVPPSRVTGLSYFDMVDTNGHGTFVAGIIAGNGSMSLSVSNEPEGSVPGADFRGKAPSANLISLNTAQYSDYQLQTNAALAGALISNNSWDYGNGDSEYDLAAASYDFATRDAVPGMTGSQPVLFVFAAGNNGGGTDDGSGGSGDTIMSPGTAKNVITVGALEQLRNITNIVTTITPGVGTNAPTTNQVAYWQPQTDSSDQVAFYSSRGNVGIGTEGSNGRFKPDVVAPGTFVVSTSSGFNGEWNTNAYYNPTNDLQTVYTFQVASPSTLVYYSVQVPPNAVGVDITISPNEQSPTPFSTNLVIYAKQSSFPGTNATDYDIISTTNALDIPPSSGGAITGIQALQGNGFSFAIGVSSNVTVNYNVTVDVLVTNDVGNLYSKLEEMNDSLGGYYRYESGTSMAAAGVSGMLALIQDYFTNSFTPAMTPSPALMKALLVNGARPVGDYGIALTNGINFQGWGLGNIQNSVPEEGLFNKADNTTTGSTFFVDQNPSTALATGDSHTYLVTVSPDSEDLYLQATLVWTDPPGDPAAAIKLVNDLELIVTNLDTGDVENYGAVYFGNDISPDIGYNLPWDTNGPPNIDTINNVQNVIIRPQLGGNYSVTVVGRNVNVNAVTAQTDNAAGQYAPNIVQDYALVISVGEGETTNAFTVTDSGIASNPTADQNITVVITTNAPLMNQMVGASSPLLGTNSLPLGTTTMWGPNGAVTIGQTNQWHFYIVTNSGPAADYTNAAFLTFGVSTLSIPRMGVYEQDIANATKPEANIDLFVTQDSTITNLNPVALSNCLAGANNSRASLANAGTQFVFYTNSAPGQVYYVGVQSEDQMGAEYDFLPVFTDTPFSSLDQNGNQIVNGLLLPMTTPTGNNAHPGVTNIFALAIMPMVVEQVIVTNLNRHQNFGDLFGTLSFAEQKVVLNNHDGFGNTFNFKPIVYDDTPNAPQGTTNSDGPGSLLNYRGQSALGPWILTELDNSAGGFTGQVSQLTLLIQPHRDLKQPGVIVAVPPGGWFVDYVDVPAGYTNLTFYGTNVTVPLPAGTPPIQMYEKLGNDPTFLDYDQEATLTNGAPPGNLISVGPPLSQGRYFVGLYNPSTISISVLLSASLGINSSVNDIFNYSASSGQPLPDDAVTPVPAPNPVFPGSTIVVPNTVTQLVTSVNVGMVVDSPRISDYTFTLVSPSGQRILLMENRGGGDTNGAGTQFVYTNVLNSTATGGAAANTNYLAVDPLGGTIPITWNFYTVRDQMTVYDTTNPADFIDVNASGPYLLYDSTYTNNPPDGLGGNIPTTVNVTYPAGISNVTIIMNQFGNPDASGGDAWTYTAGAAVTNYEYLVFTDNTNLASVPIKFAQPPFNFAELATNYALSDFDLATNGDYRGLTNIHDAFGGWTVPTNIVVVSTIVNTNNGQFALATNVVLLTNNLVSVMTDPRTALTGDTTGSNYLALANGTITRSISTVPGRMYNVTFWYRGPNIAGWWRGEGNGNDSSDPENNNNNGKLIGRFNFPAGEVGQALGFEDNGNTYQFAGTNTYVQVPASPSLNVGAGGGFTVEGWINPTNLSRPQPLVEWLAHVPTTNTADTNLTIVQGPVLDPATSHYYYLLSATNWITSEQWAKALGGDLVTLDTANEGQWVYDTFTDYGTLNRDLWTGLRDVSGTLTWVSGSTNFAYTNWVPGEPGSACPTDQFVAIMGPTNAYPGLWSLLGNNRQMCAVPPTLPVYGVVEVPQIPTNGVQFWVSGTNWTGATNVLQGCLFANIVDTNYVSHWIYSQPGLLTTNVYQHVALTFNTNSGIATLYLNGTNVASSNLYTAGVAFVPKTDGDLLLGWDMSLYTNNFYGGAMDEMSIYGRALSDAEISAIYRVSALSTNRLVGKFDPAITPAIGLAEALVSFGSSSNVIFGVNNQWEVNSFTFTATTNSMPLTISGIEPGILLDSFAVEEAPETNLYYLPEQALEALAGDPAAGDWTLQVWDNRVGAYLTNVAQLVNWQLSFVLASNAVVAASLPPETPVATTVPSGQTIFYSVTVPAWAHFATNLLVSSSQPVQVFFNATNPPTGSNPGDLTLISPPQTSGVGLPTIAVNVLPPLQTGQAAQTYYLGVQNLNAQSASVVLEVDYDILGLTNGIPFTDILTNYLTNNYGSVRYFSYDVGSNAYEATFQLLQLSGNADLVVRKGAPLPDLTSTAYGSFNNSNVDENIFVFTNSEPVPLSAGRWYLGVLNRDGTPIRYTVLAKELDLTNGVVTNGIMPAIINLTNGVPFTWTAGPGAALTNFFHFQVTNSVIGGTNVYVHGLRFELFNLSGNGDLTLQSNALPLAPPYFQSSQNGGTAPELIFVFTNNVLTNLAADWYLGVPNREVTNINYTIVAGILTNLYFPAFPEAQGAGGGALGGRFGDVYHVITTDDSGPGSLRDAINSAKNNRTVVFDISGAIYLASPLVITNSNLTIAGETSPGGGITVAGQMTTVQSAHDVVIRDLRFRSAPISAGQTNNFEGAAAADYTNGQTVAAWTVTTNQASIVSDPVNAHPGHNNFLALANGIISNSIPTVPGRPYTLSITYRGPGIAGWWRGEKNVNSSIDGNNPTNIPSFNYIPGVVGNALNFDGSSFLTVPATASLALTNMTVEGWIYPTTSGFEPIVEYGGANQFSCMHFWVNGWGLSTVPGMLYVQVRPTNPTFYSPGGLVPLNAWTHVGFTLDVPSRALRIYCNGVQVANTTVEPDCITNPPGSQPLNLGYRNSQSLDVFNGYKFTGGMDEMSIYGRALSPSEMKAIHDNGSAGKYDPALVSSEPEQSLAEASLSISGMASGILLGNNTNWQQQTFTFTATSASSPVVIKGVEPGMLLDSVTVGPGGSLAGALQFNAVSNVIADHVSTSWSTNADLAVLASTNVTVQWSIMADSLYLTNNPQGIGSLLRSGSGTLSFHHNLYADNYTGSPRFGDNLTLDFINNVIYNWGGRSGLTGGTNDLADDSPQGCTNQLNYTCNYLIAGPDTAIDSANNYNITNIAFFGGTTNTLAANWVFQTNNFIDSDTNGVLNGSDTGWGMFTNNYTRFARGFSTPPVSVDEAYQAYEKVLDFAGVNLALRDPADTNIVTNVRQQSGRIIGSVPSLPGLNGLLPYLDTDQDGIPDFWEYTFTPKLLYVPSNNNDRDGDGYTDVEEYNNWLAVPHALTVTNTPVGVDLYQLCGESGHLAFFVTNGIHGLVYLTNVLGSVTNNSPVWSNTIAVFTPTNNASTNYYGYASFDFFVTNLDTTAYFGPVTVSVIVSAVPITINSNMPPVITPLISGVSSDPTNYGGFDYYYIDVTTNDHGALFEIDNPTGPMAMVINNGPTYPSLSSYDYYTNLPPPTANMEIAVLTNTMPVPLSPGRWYLTAINESGSNVIYTAKITLLQNIYAPVFLYPSNGMIFTNIDTAPLSIPISAVDTNVPPLPLTITVVNGPLGLGITNGVIEWTPSGAQVPSTNPVAVSVSNGAFAVTNNFTIIVEASNVPPVLPAIPNQLVIIPGTLEVNNTATGPDFLNETFGYSLSSTVTGANQPVIDANGFIAWTPLPIQANSNYLFTTVVTDTNLWAVNAQSLSASNSFYVTVLNGLTPGQPVTNIIAPGGIVWIAVPVPTNAIFATNTLLFATLPVNLWFSTNLPPSITNTADTVLLTNSSYGVSVLSTNLATAPTNIVPGGVYFLGVQNLNPVDVTGAIEVDFAYAPPPGLSLPYIPDQVVSAGDTLVVTNTATDTNASAVLQYTLVNPPVGAVISANGIITWPTTTDIAPSSAVITTIVTDITDNLSATNSFNVFVLPGLTPGEPLTNVVAPNSINWYVEKVPANADMATNTLLFATAQVNLWYSTHVPPSVTNASDAELLANSTGGSRVIDTTSAPRLVPGSRYYLGVQNNNSFAVTDAVEVTFHLLPTQVISIFSIVPTNLAGANGFLLTWIAPTNDQFHLQWSPVLAPPGWANFNGVISALSTATVPSNLVPMGNGEFQYFDDGSQTGGFGSTRFYRLLLLNSPTNTAPFFLNPPAGLYYASPSNLFMFADTAKDWDIPPQVLTYSQTNSLGDTNVTIDSGTGVIAWRPTQAELGLTNFITAVVVDSGVPALSAVNTIAVVVSTNAVPPLFTSISVATNGVKFQWIAPSTNLFQIRWTTNLAPANWQTFPNIITSTTSNFSFVDTNTPLFWMKFYQLILLP